ncbi:unnamed protein product [Linum trigynum]|uniref:S-protein homolog n=1 Tax=Linum trigynum TaxID=586398 RepID=A0AAV2CRS7_9ROSI
MARPSTGQTRAIQVINKLSSKVLIVHCQSKDDDMGAHAISFNESISWQFELDIIGGTLFWCNLAIEDRRLSFVAYDADRHGNFYISVWDVCDDGLFGRYVSGVYRHFICRWNSSGKDCGYP